MAKIKLTKGELKRQRDALKQYERFLPTLQLKKQQLQMEIVHWYSLLDEKRRLYQARRSAAGTWAGLLVEAPEGLRDWVRPVSVEVSAKNIAGVDVPVFEAARFQDVEYDFFYTPAWVDHALEALRELAGLVKEIETVQKAIDILKTELRITTQRVNLFEKVKIPEAEDAIRRIKIYIGDQMANAVGRSKAAKRKIEQLETAGAAL
ncbi:MAG: V-type ATP synthase subunit D [Candidatus Omnitrophica bacterium]|nr:V-type ATP synthase subunit D [Candidatus Omnitrophota bacterium]